MFKVHWNRDAWMNTIAENNKETILLIIEPLLRCLKLSYGFVNSILLIILIKPFHEPLIKMKDWVKRQTGLSTQNS